MAKEPQDHKEKQPKQFTFRPGEGEAFTFPLSTLKVITPGFIRQNRRRDETDYFMTILEALAGQHPSVNKDLDVSDEVQKEGEEIMETIDSLTWKEHQRLQEELFKHIGASLGE